MPGKNKQEPKRRTQVKELPKDKKELSKDDQKRIKGGAPMESLSLNFNTPKG